jgi:deoxyribodipyrimidine photolyase-related protein
MSSDRLSAGIRGRVRNLALVLGDQLDAEARALRELDPEKDAVLMMEVRQEAEHVPSHRQRTVLFLSAMRHFALELLRRGLRVRYIRLESPQNSGDFYGEISRAVEVLTPQSLSVTHPGEWRVLETLKRWESDHDLPLTIYPDEHFTATAREFETWAEGRKELVMEYFYREQRRRLGVLVDDRGRPQGGRWNYDSENRDPFKGAPEPPRRYSPRTDDVTREVIDLVQRRFPDAPGRLEHFTWPVTRNQAKRALRDFIDHRLELFGRYQDALWLGEPFLYHSTISSCLNLKLLRVEECIDAALEALEGGRAPLQSVEGFIRQIIGWREFIRGVYWREGAGYRRRNRLGQTGSLPELYWTGETDMVCLRESIGQVLEHGYGHHIQRLMVTGNFALTAGVRPREVADWYLGLYVDGVDWVTAPNTVGMVMHADGGVVGTKPYASSGRYIQRMSNYCTSCRYDPGRRSGSGSGDGEGAACPFTTFYWDFLARHRKTFRGNRRMAMALRNLDRMGREEVEALSRHASRLRGDLGIGAVGGRRDGRS